MSHIVYMFFTNKRYFSRGNSLLPTEVVGRDRQSRQQASGVARQSKKSKKRTKKKKNGELAICERQAKPWECQLDQH